MTNKIKHLEMIQDIIKRMAGNSFSLKGWAVTLVSGIFALSSKDADKMYFLIAYVPIILFWLLDSYYLMQERLYRRLYDCVRKSSDIEASFSMNVSGNDFKTEKTKYISCVLSPTEILFYFPLAIVSTGIIIITNL